ncbi:ABC transporter ATP-binding protein [Yoonia sediminilitoris]|uniref:Branched-chain amino acid transport system ATP-binding protein n=1 Tax=Yoonia sediminilitoris TaxID=1286148 RepID=A0A2T6K667_9RHOB|nr:ABC transporter ATP-binding protein [Yoonia sediminilitoris]PUB10163.1 branched-chain amino acid transport system ATP-binding protein [Yoonia sediminilitoris]RCW89685.1 branched-chain amino acid transport system ATP-binding protein [Yoonia sediminilitoris]
MLELTDVTVRYGQHRALEGASVKVAKGEIVVILGANGAGKSTLLKAASGICEGAVQGSVRIDGTELTGLAANKIVDAGLALVPEGRGVFPDLSVRENLTLGAYADRARDEENVTLDRVYSLFPKLRERGKQIVRTMSGGEQQMVAIGRAMMSNPTILTLDEPSLGLSPLLSKELFQNLSKVRDLGIGVLMVEQNAKQSLAIADRGYLIENAHVVHEDSAENLMRDPAVQAAYLGAGASEAPATHRPTEQEPEPVIESFAIKPRSQQTLSADALLGSSIADLVARASDQSAARPAAAVTKPAQVPVDRLAAAMAEIERAATAARNRPKAAPTRRTAAPPQPLRQEPAQADKAPPVIEVYRAPRVEVYRRQPDGTGFERK